MRLDAPTVRIKLVGEELRRYREGTGLTLEQVSERIGISKPKLSKMETGNVGQRCDEVAGLLAIYGVKGQERKELLELTNQAHQSGLWMHHYPSLAQRIAALRILESRATRLIDFECHVIPGLLQTVPYIEALMRNVVLMDDGELIAERVAARVQRQAVLRKLQPPIFQAIIMEQVLHNTVGDHAVMRGQLRFLVEAVQQPNINLRIIPASAGNHPGFNGSFMRIQFYSRPGVIVLENRTSNLFLEDDEERVVYNDVLVELLSVALDQEQSVALMRDLETRLAQEQLQ